MCRILWTYARWTKRRRARFTRRSIKKRSRSKYGSGLTRSSHERNFRGTTMATKTSSKTATRKPVARKTAAGQKPLAPAKPRVSTKKLKTEVDASHAEAAPPATPHAQRSPTQKVTSHHEVERVSLIDKKKPRKKAEDGEAATKRDVLPPISRIRASLDKPVLPPKPSAPEKTT